jgi:glycosyltransferase involved in cell wall biosynthesis
VGRQVVTPSGIVVVIPAFRAAHTIDETLESVAAQTLPAAEVVVVDDGSDDGTADVVTRWERRLPLRVLRQENAGPAAARRRGIADSTAPLIALLDADDVLLPGHLATLVAAHDLHGGVISADAVNWHGAGAPANRTRFARRPVPPPARQRVEIVRENFVFICSLFSRSDYVASGGFRDGFTAAEDWDLWIRMIRNGAFVHGASGPTVRYRIASTSLTRQVRAYDSYLAVLDAARPGCETDAERRVLERRVRWYRGRRQLALAEEAASAGQTNEARRLAAGGFTASPRLWAEALLVSLSPKRAVRSLDWLRARFGE